MNLDYNSGVASLMRPKVRRQKFGVGTLIFLLIFGVAFTVVGFLVIQASKIDPSWTRVDGKVTSYNVSQSSNSTTYPEVVTYNVNNQSYTATSSLSSSSQPTIGSPKQVAYNPQNPAEAKVVGGASQGFMYIFPVIGIVALVLSPIFFVRSLRRSKDISNLTQTGLKVQGIITNIQTIGSTSNSNGSTSYKIFVSAADKSGAVQEYASDTLTGIGGLAMADYQTNPIPMDVYINPADPSDYYVDISEVRSLTPDRIMQLISQAAASHSVQPPQQTPSPLGPTPPVNPIQ